MHSPPGAAPMHGSSKEHTHNPMCSTAHSPAQPHHVQTNIFGAVPFIRSASFP